MKTRSDLLFFVLALTASSLCAQQPPPPGAIIPPPAGNTPQTPQAVVEHLIKQVTFDNRTTLSKAIRTIESECPEFQAVVVCDPGCPDDPALPNMSLKNLPLSQILEVIGKVVPDVEVKTVEGSNGNVWIFRVHNMGVAGPIGPGLNSELPQQQQSAPAAQSSFQPPAPGAQPAFQPPVPAALPTLTQLASVAQPTVALPPPAAESTVSVYRLSPLIRDGSTGRSNDILSLIQATLDATGAEGSLMKLHTPTETLVFKGTRAQTEAVNSALKALQPTPAELGRSQELEQAQKEIKVLTEERERGQRALERAKMETDAARNDADAARKRATQQTEEIEKLQARLRVLGEKSQ